MTDFSVVIPVHNRANLIAETIDSVLHQTHPARELIVVDDGSTDNTVEVVSRYSGHVMCIQSQKEGVQAARNRGILAASFQTIALCDSDDIWLPDYLNYQSRLLSAEPTINFSFSNLKLLIDGRVSEPTKFDEAPEGWWDSVQPRMLQEGYIFGEDFAQFTFRFHPIFPSATIFSKELYESVGKFDPRLKGFATEDGEFTLRCLYRGTIGAVPEPLVLIRKHEHNSTHDKLTNLLSEIALLQFARDNHAPSRPHRPIIEDEIERRMARAIDCAFVQRDHQRVAQLFDDLPARRRTLKLTLKRIVAGLPRPMAKAANLGCQSFGNKF